jgi:hypothetical protein
MFAAESRPSRWRHAGRLWAIGGAVALFAALGAYRPINDPDLYWHLKVGESILEHRAVPRVDEFSFTFAGRPVPLVDWASEAMMATLHAHFGEAGLFTLAALLAAATMLLTALRMRAEGIPLLVGPATAFLLLVYDVTSFRFAPRPQTFLWVCLGLLMWLFERAEARRELRPLWGIPLLVLVWSNLHGSSFVAVVLAGALALGYLVSLRGRWRATIAPLWRSLLLLAAATVAACFVVPNPLGRFQVAVDTMVSRYTTSVLSEWQPPTPSVWLGPAGVLLVATALSFALDRRRLKPPELAVSAVAIWLGFRHVRFLPILALVVGPIAYRHLTAVLSSRISRDQGWKRIVPALDGCLAVTLLAGFAVGSLGLDSKSAWLGGTGRPRAELVGSAYPVGATRFLARERPQGNMYNTFHFGGYLMYHLGPAVKVFIDGRTANLYDDAHMRDVMEIRRIWPRVFARWNIQYATTQHGEVDESLAADPHWSLVFFDDAALVFVRNDGPNAELARRLAYRELLPPFATAPENDPVRIERMDAEAQRGVAESPASALAHILRGRVRGLRHDLAGFEGDMNTAIQLDPSRPEPWQRLGLLALGRHQPAEAVRNLGRALELEPRQADLRLYLARAHWAAGDQVSARETLRPLAVGGRTLDELVASVAHEPMAPPRAPSN